MKIKNKLLNFFFISTTSHSRHYEVSAKIPNFFAPVVCIVGLEMPEVPDDELAAIKINK